MMTDIKEKEDNQLEERKAITIRFKSENHRSEASLFIKTYGFTTMQSFFMQLLDLAMKDKEVLLKLIANKNIK